MWKSGGFSFSFSRTYIVTIHYCPITLQEQHLHSPPWLSLCTHTLLIPIFEDKHLPVYKKGWFQSLKPQRVNPLLKCSMWTSIKDWTTSTSVDAPSPPGPPLADQLSNLTTTSGATRGKMSLIDILLNKQAAKVASDQLTSWYSQGGSRKTTLLICCGFSWRHSTKDWGQQVSLIILVCAKMSFCLIQFFLRVASVAPHLRLATGMTTSLYQIAHLA